MFQSGFDYVDILTIFLFQTLQVPNTSHNSVIGERTLQEKLYFSIISSRQKATKMPQAEYEAMILVRLPRFRQTPDSLLGFLLCQSLLQKGHHLLIKSDVQEQEEMIEEKATAEVMTKMHLGIARILQPGDLHLLEFRKNISTIVGVAPRMIDSTVSLKEIFESKLIITTNVSLNSKIIGYLTERVDELWSIGPQLYKNHQINILKMSKLEHKCFTFFQNRNLEFPVHITEEKLEFAECDRKVVSIWNESEKYVIDGIEQQVTGSRLEDFDIVLNAISKVNEGTSEFRIVWFVYGLKDHNSKLFKALCRDHINPERLSTHDSLQGILYNCSLFILPDQNEAYHNITATSALIKQIPCLVPHTSSIGRILLQFGFTSGPTILNLRGVPHLDEKTWTDSIGEKLCTDFNFPEVLSKRSGLIPQVMGSVMMNALVI